ncbi:GMC family oxidoreductase [Streptomyces sp. NPDC059564]|uniref:GMC family oxidoreductase n=1 Tax=Streptomyces sp. NPDC059564 TaxID=3346865 RepID=UPI0036B71EDD
MLSWQPVEESSLLLALRDAFLDKLSLAARAEPLPSGPVSAALDTDVNSKANVDRSSQGAFATPMTVRAGRRHAVRERLLDVRSRHAGNLAIATDALAERIVFEERQGELRATAVAYLSGRHLYQASPEAVPRSAAERAGLRRTVRVTREVIVAGGAFNTPQLLMLSGIGPRDHLAEHGITPLLDLPGVGANLQDRYEVSVVSALGRDFTALAGCTFQDRDDPCLAQWRASPMPAATPYDPTRRPVINFRSMDDGRGGDADVAAMIEAIRSIRSINAKAGLLDSVREEVPGPRVSTDAQLAAWIRREAWGHHASCTAAIGPAGKRGSVLDGRLRVHGTANVRVVDASAFPRIPGLFIMAPTLVLAEKASQDILRAAR